MPPLAPDLPLPDCDVCTSVAAYRMSYGERELDVRITEDRLAERLDDGRMHVLRADVPLRDMVPLAESDLKYTIALLAKCAACGTTWFTDCASAAGRLISRWKPRPRRGGHGLRCRSGNAGRDNGRGCRDVERILTTAGGAPSV